MTTHRAPAFSAQAIRRHGRSACPGRTHGGVASDASGATTSGRTGSGGRPGRAAVPACLLRVVLAGARLTVFLALSASTATAETKSREAWKVEYVRQTGLAAGEEPRDAGAPAQLGRMLFFEPRLSGSNRIACATCHNPALSWGDGLPRAIGADGRALERRTPTLLNVAWSELLAWDGRFDSLEAHALFALASPEEMGQPLDSLSAELATLPEYRSGFESAFPGEGVTPDTVARALAAFQRTLVSAPAPFDRWVAGDERAISESAKRGFDLFNDKANCVACHSGWNFTDGSFHDIGIASEDPGRGRLLPGIALMRHAFKTPTLRDVERRYPYMHDGSLADLPAVIHHYERGGIERPSLSPEMRPLQLTNGERSDLLAFLRTLTSADRSVSIPVLPR